MIARSKKMRIAPLQKIKARSIEVLVVVGDEALRRKIVKHLKEEHYDPIEAMDQTSALACLQQRDCDAVILDTAEPMLIDVIVREIPRREPRPGIVFLTLGSAPPEHLANVDLWRVACVERTRNINELSQCIATLLGHRATS